MLIVSDRRISGVVSGMQTHDHPYPPRLSSLVDKGKKEHHSPRAALTQHGESEDKSYGAEFARKLKTNVIRAVAGQEHCPSLRIRRHWDANGHHDHISEETAVGCRDPG